MHVIKQNLENTLAIAEDLQRKNPSKSLEKALEGLKIAESKELDEYKKSFLCQIGNAYFHKGNYDAAIEAYQKALEVAKQQGDDEKITKYLIRIGASYRQMKHYKLALIHYFDALQRGFENQNGTIYGNIASIYYDQKDYSKAIEYLNEGLKLSYKFNQYGDIAGTLTNMSIIATQAGEADKAIQYCKEAFDIAQKHGFIRVEIYALINTGNAYKSKGDFETARAYYLQAQDIANENNFSHDVFLTEKRIAETFEESGNTTEALQRYETLKSKLSDDKDKVFLEELLKAMIEGYQKVEAYQKLSEVQAELIEYQQEIIKREQDEGTKKLLQEKDIEINLLKSKQKEIEQKNEVLSEFAYIVAHDLKEPLRSITSFVNLLQKRMPNLNEEQKEFMDFIVQGTNRMSDLLRDLLQYVGIDENADLKKVVNLDRVIQNALMNLQDAIMQADAEITFENLPKVFCNEFQITSLFQNLIHNALKFKKENENSKIYIRFTEEEKSYTFEIADNGIGIAPEYQKRIFKIFNRLNNQNEGTGIGLAICQKVIQVHDGKIWLESEEGKGTTFYFTLNKV